jgi:hypothetical protein
MRKEEISQDTKDKIDALATESLPLYSYDQASTFSAAL